MDKTTSLPGCGEPIVAGRPEWIEPAPSRSVELRAGDLCPACGKARLDYNGLLNLACPNCGYSLGGGCT